MNAGALTQLAALLRETFPTWRELARDCWVYQAIAQNQKDFGGLIDCIREGNGSHDFMVRLRAEHPVNRSHHDDYDKRLLDVFTEGEAFAWAYRVAQLDRPRFMMTPGAPDIAAGSVWLEAKTVRHSRGEERFRDEIVKPALERQGFYIYRAVEFVLPGSSYLRKFQAHFEDAVLKWTRQDSHGKLIVFFNMFIDFGISPNEARGEMIAWAATTAERQGVGIVICEQDKWYSPICEALV